MLTQDIAIKTLFAEFQEAVFKRFEIEQEARNQWSFISKKLKGKKYWYQQRYINGRMIQKYYAPSNADNDKIVLEKRSGQTEKRKLLKKLAADEQKRAAMLKRGGLPSLDHLTASIIELFSDSLLTYKNGILIGSYAFSAYSGMLGAAFEKSSLKTLDIDIACDPLTAISSDRQINITELLKSLNPLFRAVPSLSTKHPPHSFVGPDGIRVDILAPLRGKPRGNIRLRNIIDAGAEPLRFLDFLIKDPANGVLIGPKGGIPVTVPHPARYAVHKLITSSRRPVTETAKRTKDILQAEQLIAICAKECPTELKSAYKDAVGRGKKWKSSVLKGIASLPKPSLVWPST